MTREEAIEILRDTPIDIRSTREDDIYSLYATAQHMAIDALGQEPIIHCKDCKHWHEWENGTGSCHRSDMWVGSDYDDYCSNIVEKVNAKVVVEK